MAIILAFDTATHACSAALLCQGKVTSRFAIIPRQHAERLLPMIDELLIDSSVRLTDLDAIAFTQGPGSFMGVRLATGFAQGLAFGAQRPVIPLSTLQVLAQAAYQTHQVTSVLSGWDARMHSLYWGGYELNPLGLMQSVIADQLTVATDFQLPAGKWHAVGNAWDVYQLSAQFIGIYGDLFPQAEAMIPLALAALNDGQLHNPMAIEPVYLRERVVYS